MNCNEKVRFEVCVKCFTFNHSSYIKDALDGFCFQETSFPYICVIVDDASTDGEPSIINKYLESYFDLEDKTFVRNEETGDYVLTFARHKINKNCFFEVLLLKYNHYSIGKPKIPYYMHWHGKVKYLAFCEGDDYWNDTLKLQKQFDYMESNPECSLCFHANYREYGNRKIVLHNPKIMRDKYGPKEVILLGGGMMATNSMFYHAKDFLLKEEQPDFWAHAPVGDVPLCLYLSTIGYIGYINEYMCTYRLGSTGSFTSKIRFSWKTLSLGKSLSRMLKEFDKYTEYKYHKYIIIGRILYLLRSYRDVLLMIKQKILSLFRRNVN